MKRRNFIQATAVAATGIGLVGKTLGKSIVPAFKPQRPVCVFSKCLQFLSYEELGEEVAKMDFDGVDLTVRSGGHVLPENVASDLPKAVKAIRKNGLDVYMIVTGINNANDPMSKKILSVASELGIRYYRTGYLKYDLSKPLQVFLDNHKKTVEKLEKLNRKYNIHGGYQNHSGKNIGAPVWDLYDILKDVDPQYQGIQYDICHTTIEGGYSWRLGMKRIAPWIRTIDIKDFLWSKNDEGKWRTPGVPLGDGMVDFDQFLDNYKALNVEVPISIHYEYNLGAAEQGRVNPTMSHENIYQSLKRDLNWFRLKLKDHRL